MLRMDRRKIQLIMARKNISRSQLAVRYGCSRQYLDQFFKTTGASKPETIHRMASALDSSVADIVCDS